MRCTCGFTCREPVAIALIGQLSWGPQCYDFDFFLFLSVLWLGPGLYLRNLSFPKAWVISHGSDVLHCEIMEAARAHWLKGR